MGVTWILFVACDSCGSGPAMVSKILRLSHLDVHVSIRFLGFYGAIVLLTN